MQVGENAKYTSEQILQEYIKVMSYQIERGVIAEVRNNLAFAVMIDGSDGANVITGKRNGVAKKLKDLNPKLTDIHCICHRLALASKDAFNEIPYLKKYEETLAALFKFYHNSSVRAAALKEIQRVLEDPELKLKEAKHVR